MWYFKDATLTAVNKLANKLGYQLVPDHFHIMTWALWQWIIIWIDETKELDCSIHIKKVVNNDSMIWLQGVYITKDMNAMRDYMLNSYSKPIKIEESEIKRWRGRPRKSEDACKTKSSAPKKWRWRPARFPAIKKIAYTWDYSWKWRPRKYAYVLDASRRV